MLPPGGIAGIAGFGYGFSATMASAVTSKPVTDAASWSACRATLVWRSALFHLSLGWQAPLRMAASGA